MNASIVPKILVTGATGNNGSELIKRLSGAGIPVRGMVRKQPDASYNALPNVEFITADFAEGGSIRRALEGIESAFLVTNSSERVQEQQLRFVEEARASKLQRIVYLSQLHADKDSPVRFLRYHAVIEEAIASSGIAFTHLRPNLMMQALLGFRSAIAGEGRLYAPIGQARVSIVDIRDIAAVAMAALTQDGHEGSTYDLTGPEALTHQEMAACLSQALGKPVSFVDIAPEAMRKALLSFKVPEWQADGLIEDYAHYRRGEAADISRAIEQITGTPPRTFLTFAQDSAQAFLQSGS